MYKKIIILVIAVAIFVCLILAGGIAIKSIFSSQYNSNGISRYLCITIDDTYGKEYIYKNSEYTVYTFQLEDAYFMDINANEVSLYDALSTKKISIDDMIEKCNLNEYNNMKIYAAENYQIILYQKECIITPLDININDVL